MTHSFTAISVWMILTLLGLGTSAFHIQSSPTSRPFDLNLKAVNPEVQFSDLGPAVEIIGLNQYESYLTSHPNDLVTFEFYSPSCKSCRSLKQKLQEAASHLQSSNIKIVLVNIMEPENREIVSKLRIRSLPYVKMHRGAEVLDEIRAGPSIVSDTLSKLEKHASLVDDGLVSQRIMQTLRAELTDAEAIQTAKLAKQLKIDGSVDSFLGDRFGGMMT
mmetsp:Transcript_9992/g.14004  ORF Transcript_9992/g.14004 Transcript_9992/m.14004 type:complete len:218 (-) Transcript_9992:103-756(-)